MNIVPNRKNRVSSRSGVGDSAAVSIGARDCARRGTANPFDFQHGQSEFAHGGVRDFRREQLCEPAFHFIHRRRIGVTEAEKLAVAAADDGQKSLFLAVVRLAHEHDELTPINRLGRRFGFIELLLGLRKLAQASSAMTTDVAACAMHMRRALVANSSFALLPASDSGMNIIGPSGAIRNRVGCIRPILRME